MSAYETGIINKWAENLGTDARRPSSYANARDQRRMLVASGIGAVSGSSPHYGPPGGYLPAANVPPQQAHMNYGFLPPEHQVPPQQQQQGPTTSTGPQGLFRNIFGSRPLPQQPQQQHVAGPSQVLPVEYPSPPPYQAEGPFLQPSAPYPDHQQGYNVQQGSQWPVQPLQAVNAWDPNTPQQGMQPLQGMQPAPHSLPHQPQQQVHMGPQPAPAHPAPMPCLQQPGWPGPSQHGGYVQRDAHPSQYPAQKHPALPELPGPKDHMSAMMDMVARTNELLRKESNARTYGLRALLDFIYDNWDAFGAAADAVRGGPLGAVQGSTRLHGRGSTQLGQAMDGAWLWRRPASRQGQVPQASRVLDPETDIRLASLNVGGLDFIDGDAATAQHLFSVTTTIWQAHPDICALQGVRSPAAVSKLAALLTLWADPSDGAWHHVVSCQQAGAGEGGTSAEAPTHLAYLWRDRAVRPYKENLDGQAWHTIDRPSAARVLRSPFFGAFWVRGRPLLLVNVHLTGVSREAATEEAGRLARLAGACASNQDSGLQQRLWVVVLGSCGDCPEEVPADVMAKAGYRQLASSTSLARDQQYNHSSMQQYNQQYSQAAQQYEAAPQQKQQVSSVQLDAIWLLEEPFFVPEGARGSKWPVQALGRAGAMPGDMDLDSIGAPPPRPQQQQQQPSQQQQGKAPLCNCLVWAEIKVVPLAQPPVLLAALPDFNGPRQLQPTTAVAGGGSPRQSAPPSPPPLQRGSVSAYDRDHGRDRDSGVLPVSDRDSRDVPGRDRGVTAGGYTSATRDAGREAAVQPRGVTGTYAEVAAGRGSHGGTGSGSGSGSPTGTGRPLGQLPTLSSASSVSAAGTTAGSSMYGVSSSSTTATAAARATSPAPMVRVSTTTPTTTTAGASAVRSASPVVNTIRTTTTTTTATSSSATAAKPNTLGSSVTSTSSAVRSGSPTPVIGTSVTSSSSAVRSASPVVINRTTTSTSPVGGTSSSTTASRPLGGGLSLRPY